MLKIGFFHGKLGYEACTIPESLAIAPLTYLSYKTQSGVTITYAYLKTSEVSSDQNSIVSLSSKTTGHHSFPGSWHAIGTSH